jgi:hypothetical protein
MSTRKPELRVNRAAAWTLLVAGALAPAVGCGAHDSSVYGTVTLDEKPLETGTVTFHPVGGGAVAYGRIGADGSYRLHTGAEQGLAPGEYVVTVVATAPPPDPRSEVVGKLLTPARYNRRDQTDLRFTIARGTNRIDLALQTK